MTSIELRSGAARAVLHPTRGGLLAELALTGPGGDPRDVLWLPDDFSLDGSGWPGGGAPLCFPFAGRVFHQGTPFRYALGGVERNMPLHGFAYAAPWEVSGKAASEATLTLTDTPPSRELFPFRFRVTARYRLEATRLTLALTVTHTGEPGAGAMPVALGLHPYFATGAPLPHLETTAKEEHQVLASGAAGKAAPRAAATREPVDKEDLQNLILGAHDRPEARLVFPDRGEALTVAWAPAERWRYLVLWSRDVQQFYCVEPWMGLPDAVSTGAGAQWLAPGETSEAELAIALAPL